MSEHPAGLWPAPGDGVLARRGNLIILTSAESGDLVDTLLDVLEQLAAAGGDGRKFADAVAEILEADATALSGEGGSSVLAFGPAGQGMAVTVCGTAWAELRTARGPARLEAVQPGMLMRCLLASPVGSVVGGLGAGAEAAARTDRFSRLDAGTVRASGLGYYPAGHAGGEGAPEPAPAAAWPAGAGLQAAEQGQDAPAEEPAPSVPASAPVDAGGPMRTELWSSPAQDEPDELVPPAAAGPGGTDHEMTIAPQSFDAVLLAGGGPGDEVDLAQRDPLPVASDLPPGTASFATAAPIVQGVYCANGHFDDPEARTCAVCGVARTEQQAPTPGPRPPLGVLVLDDGSAFQLDSDYVLGREPGLDASVASGQSRPLRVADDSGTVSRVHARVQLDGWHVLVTDLGSANGTKIKLPYDAAEEMLVPHVPVVLAAGSKVDLGARELRYESHRGE